MEYNIAQTRRKLIVTSISAGIVGPIAGCFGSSGPAKITDDRLIWQSHRTGVLVKLEQTSSDESGPVTIHAELLDGDEIVAERKQELPQPPEGGESYAIWFNNLSESDRERIDSARATIESDSGSDGSVDQETEGGSVGISVGRGYAEATNEAVVIYNPVENFGDVRATIEYETELFLDGDSYSRKRQRVTLSSGESREVSTRHSVSRTDSMQSDSFSYDVRKLDSYQA